VDESIHVWPQLFIQCPPDGTNGLVRYTSYQIPRHTRYLPLGLMDSLTYPIASIGALAFDIVTFPIQFLYALTHPPPISI
jgi:hypothetical protein